MFFNDISSWKSLYNNIRADHWPVCESIDDFIQLPDFIKVELVDTKMKSMLTELTTVTDLKKSLSLCPVFNYLLHVSTTMFKPGEIKARIPDLNFIYGILTSQKPNNILEIGRYAGLSTTALAMAVADNGHGRVYSFDIIDHVSDTVKTFISDQVELIVESSENLIKHPAINGIKFGFCFVDGDHSYKMALMDIETCVELTEDNATILVHDNDNQEVIQAIADALKRNPCLTDGGDYYRTRLLYKNNNKNST
jgi:Methyltransferase domain